MDSSFDSSFRETNLAFIKILGVLIGALRHATVVDMEAVERSLRALASEAEPGSVSHQIFTGVATAIDGDEGAPEKPKGPAFKVIDGGAQAK
jgi:hypothetical protein